MDNHARRLTSAEVERALALIEKAHQLEGQRLDVDALDRAKRILTREISPDEARVEMNGALRAIIAIEGGQEPTR